MKNTENITKKNTNSYKYDDYNSLNERKKSININLQQYNKKQTNISKNSFICNMMNINKNIIINDMIKKNNIGINNINSINNNNTNKKQMTIIQNFSKYKKKGTINITKNICNICNKNQNQCHKENMSNNFLEDHKVNKGKEIKKNKNLNINNVINRTIDEKRKKNEYYHSQPKVNYKTNNCYTN